MSESRWSAKKVLWVLLGSVGVTLLLAVGSLYLCASWRERRLLDPAFTIQALLQTGPEKEGLKSAYLSELLGLSVDAPQNLYAFNLLKGEKGLLSSPLIAKAHLKRIPPSTLYIDYELRRPIASLCDYRNVGMDRQGHLFPIAPFFSPKELPEIYLGLPPFGASEDSFGRKGGNWDHPIANRYFQLALDLLDTFEGSPWREGLRIQRIDVSNAFAPTLGRREIVLFTEEEIFLRKGEKELRFQFPKVLRLAPKDYGGQLQNFFALRRNMLEDYKKQLAELKEGGKFAPRIIDLRIGQLAFVENRNL
jgi:hypothetical protein